ncbi:MAG TPA: SUF system NifU family Fe-S cluster assembly protein [Chloroflexi bacterium]|mgnify:FL=1|nr:SUF system NifU family Fe-S cluster assembly protein [Chloroflexota bacterium]HCU98100.1 SUF system NifU family Fe-S cluster assembly protein [Chloroflexota bacterium]|tara:strand:- start:42 stop:428 length:387 start_codon:yes stop_codon:yes gene_type:complete
MDDMYREVILDHYKNPRHNGELDPADISYQDDNPLCGDMIRIDLRVDKDNKIIECAFSGHGCAISQASASMLMEDIKGKTLDDIKDYTRDDILEMLGIELGPVRLKCAMLSLKVLKVGAYGVQEWVED